MDTTILNPQYIYVQATEPSDKTQGKLWFDTDDNKLYSSDGTSYALIVNVDTQFLQNLVGENALDILELQATASLDGGQSATMLRDIYTDTTGFLDSVNTSNTTTTFIVDKYYNATSDAGIHVTEAHGETLNANANKTTKSGFTFTIGGTGLYLKSILKHASTPATRGYLLDASCDVLATATFIGNTATFSVPYPTLTASTKYYVGVDAQGSSIREDYRTNIANFPISGTALTWTAGLWDGQENATTGAGVVNIITNDTTGLGTPDDLLVETTADTITAGAVSFQLLTYGESLAGTSTITYDVSFDGGSNYQEGILAGVETTITDSGTSVIIRQNINKGASTSLGSAKGYALLVW